MVTWVKCFGLFGGFLLAHLAPIRGDDELVYVAYINGSDDQEIYINGTEPLDLDSEAGRREAARKGISMVLNTMREAPPETNFSIYFKLMTQTRGAQPHQWVVADKGRPLSLQATAQDLSDLRALSELGSEVKFLYDTAEERRRIYYAPWRDLSMRVNFEGPFAHFTVAALGLGYNGHLMGHLPPWGKDFDLVWAATKAFFDADGEQPRAVHAPRVHGAGLLALLCTRAGGGAGAGGGARAAPSLASSASSTASKAPPPMLDWLVLAEGAPAFVRALGAAWAAARPPAPASSPASSSRGGGASANGLSPRRGGGAAALDVRLVREVAVRLRADLPAVTVRVDNLSNELRFHFAVRSHSTF